MLSHSDPPSAHSHLAVVSPNPAIFTSMLSCGVLVCSTLLFSVAFRQRYIRNAKAALVWLCPIDAFAIL